jgi:hypothetical protein
MTSRPQQSSPGAAADKIGPDDPRYADLTRRGFNKRFTGRPDYVHLVRSTEQVVDAVQEAVRSKLRLAVRSGGHCLEGFVADPAVQAVIDTSLMTGVCYDRDMAAFAVEAGATLGEIYRTLFLGWGVTIPAGESPDIGAGGHLLGGAFGFLCREHGLAADYLYAVEAVVVDETGTASCVVATREPSDPNRDLWWAHTGGGGGNFGIVTRYWLRSPGAAGPDPALLLPRAPDSVMTFRVAWNWEDVDQSAFTGLMRNHGTWCERNGGVDSPSARLFSILFLRRRQYGTLELKGLSTAGAAAERLVDEHLAVINEGVGVAHTREVERNSWLARQDQGRVPSQALHGSPDRRRLSISHPHCLRCSRRDARSRNLWRKGQRRCARRDGLGPAGLDSHHVVYSRLAGPSGRSPTPDLGSNPLPGPVRRNRGRASARTAVRRRSHQSSGRRPRRSGVEHLGCSLAHAVLQGQLPPTAADQGPMGSSQRVPPRPLHPGAVIEPRAGGKDV